MLDCGSTTPQDYPEWSGFGRRREREWGSPAEAAGVAVPMMIAEWVAKLRIYAPASGAINLWFGRAECCGRPGHGDVELLDCLVVEGVGRIINRSGVTATSPPRDLALRRAQV
jgi:hypothetical protein